MTIDIESNINLFIPNFIKKKKEIHIVNRVDTSHLGERQKLVYDTLRTKVNGASAKELSMQLFEEGKVFSHERNSVHPRLNELIKEGLVKVVGKKTCQWTDRKVSVYKVV